MVIPLREIILLAYIRKTIVYERNYSGKERIFTTEQQKKDKEYLDHLYSLATGKSGIEVYIITCNGKVSQEAYDSLSKAQQFIRSRSDKPEMADEYVFISAANRYEIHPVTVK